MLKRELQLVAGARNTIQESRRIREEGVRHCGFGYLFHENGDNTMKGIKRT